MLDKTIEHTKNKKDPKQKDLKQEKKNLDELDENENLTHKEKDSKEEVLNKISEALKSDKKSLETKNSEKKLISDLQNQVSELKEKFVRTLAEMENLRSRSNKMLEEAKMYSIFNFAKEILSVMDSLDMALNQKSSSDDLQNEEGISSEKILEGVFMTKKQLSSIFEKNNLYSIEPNIGDKFDYNTHYAISKVKNQEYKDGQILKTMQIGYRINERLIRPASVVVVQNEDDV